MGILDDLKMGFGIEEKTRDYYDRTAKTIARNDGAGAADRYRERIGFTPGGTHTGSYGSAPHYSDTSTGPQVSDFRQGSRPSNAPTPGTFSHSMGQMPGMMGLLARLFNGSGNNMPEQPLMSNAQRQVRPRRRGATQAAAQSGYNAQPVTETPLTSMSNQMSAGPNMMTEVGARPSMQFSPYDASGTFIEPPMTDNNMFGVAGAMPTMPATGVDVPFARRMDGMAIDAPADFFPTADGVVMAGSPEAEEAAYQQWLTSPQGERYNDAAFDDGFRRRMYNVVKSLKAGKF